MIAKAAFPTFLRFPLGGASQELARMSLHGALGGRGQIGGALGVGRGAAAVFDPSDIAGMVFRYKATSVSGSDGSQVSAWADLSVNGYSLSQATLDNQPLLQTSEVNGKNAIDFVSVDFLSSSAPSNTKPVTFFAIIKPTNFANYRTVIGGNTSTAAFSVDIEQTTGALRFLKQDVALIGTSTSSLTANAVGAFCVTYSAAGAYAFYINAAAAGTGTNNQTFTDCGTLVGAYRAAAPGAAPYLGLMCEMIKYDSVLTGANITSLFAYARSEWGTP